MCCDTFGAWKVLLNLLPEIVYNVKCCTCLSVHGPQTNAGEAGASEDAFGGEEDDWWSRQNQHWHHQLQRVHWYDAGAPHIRSQAVSLTVNYVSVALCLLNESFIYDLSQFNPSQIITQLSSIKGKYFRKKLVYNIV